MGLNVSPLESTFENLNLLTYGGKNHSKKESVGGLIKGKYLWKASQNSRKNNKKAKKLKKIKENSKILTKMKGICKANLLKIKTLGLLFEICKAN